LANPKVIGIYNLGTGISRSFLDLVKAIGAALGRPIAPDFIEMPEALRGCYQYFTRADMAKFRSAGLDLEFLSLEDGVRDYVQSFLSRENRYR
jgi:ADP-L-glycero-D-manno-heptose 6-epimerase